MTATAEHYRPVPTQVVVTLRDLRDEHPREVRRYPLYGRTPRGERQRAWYWDLTDLLVCALTWREHGTEEELQDLEYFVRQVALWIGGDSSAHLPIVGVDMVLSVTREPAPAP